MTDENHSTDSVTESNGQSTSDHAGPSRRRLLATAAGLGIGSFGGVPMTSAAATQEGDDGDEAQEDEPEGFAAEVLAPHAPFIDGVAAAFAINVGEDDEEVVVKRDASTVLFAKVMWEPEGTSGWHTHPGPVIVNVTEGQIEIVHAEDCSTQTYSCGDAFLDPGTHIEEARNPSDTDPAVAYAAFLGVPEGESPTNWVQPQDC